MKRFPQTLWLVVLVAVLSSSFLMPRAFADDVPEEMKTISEYSILWGDPSESLESVRAASPERWKAVKIGDVIPEKPKDVTTAWIRLQLPSQIPKGYGLYIQGIYAQHLSVYIDQRLVKETKFDFNYDQQSSLFPISSEDEGHMVLMKSETSMGRLGITSIIKLDHYDVLLRTFVLGDLQNIILGSALLFIAVIVLIGSIFIKRVQRTDWVLVSTLFISLGIIFITYTPFMYESLTKYGALYSALFDISLVVFLPALTFYFERIFGKGKYKVIYWLRKSQTVYSVFVIICLFINILSDYGFNKFYFFVAVTILGFIMILQFSLLIGSSILLMFKGNKEAVIFSVGFASLAFMSTLDLILYYMNSQNKQIFLWKWGILGFIVALIVILGRRFAINQERIINYSKELEFYNRQLQQSEKMEIISQLAASIAHEVRNPLQVTRGFLQLVASRSDKKNQEYMMIAIEELDRASVIISDFLTFSKPQGEETKKLNLFEEFRQIEGIIFPLVALHSGRISVDVPEHLIIQGNSSKLKQVLINLIKNSIEAFQDDGVVDIWAYEKDEEVFIHIKDNGEGIEAAQLAQLGVPYYSTKTKGTGLGLMVSFQIIENMKGYIQFKSQKNLGTEVILRFPTNR
ncbi:HAMP domain-containing histidine kinase [Paenibacillus sp. CGMCC 1.16610]|uniref:histidine kinase n=1 Tax=Paenibacillus anseongense TaxID=2682845 RepID=A0ABW9UFE8_9BACL|nr:MULTISPECIES: HAMP domain-containing sensor histidine kinase [Paenibacillus]MBA2944134.1 HAMP domain-containing histidine kinase [Paenibacillus sp. CGMCC 1.16610]MVQ38024.1 sensor histidine kinase [Paenibacillus anseongense]